MLASDGEPCWLPNRRGLRVSIHDTGLQLRKKQHIWGRVTVKDRVCLVGAVWDIAGIGIGQAETCHTQ